MGVGLCLGKQDWEIGAVDFLTTFFSTVSYHLEPEGWGTRYPFLMRHLYQGRLDAMNAARALREVLEIRERLKAFKPDQLVWRVDQPELKLPWMIDPMRVPLPDDTTLADYFMTSNGKDLFDVLCECLHALEERGGVLKIVPY